MLLMALLSCDFSLHLLTLTSFIPLFFPRVFNSWIYGHKT